MKRLYLLSLLLMVPFAQADISSNIDSSCGDAEPVISLSDPSKEYSHPGDLNQYSENVCVSGLEDPVEVTSGECSKNVGFYISGRNRKAHLSFTGAYNLKVCTGKMKTRLTSPLGACKSNETALFSVSPVDESSPKVNLHAADTNVFDRLVCGSISRPENVSLQLEFNHTSSDEVYFSGERVYGNESFSSSSYPYLVAQGDGYVAGIVKKDFLSAGRNISDNNLLQMSTKRKSASFLLPFTKGDYFEIDDQETTIRNDNFVSNIEPSFGFLMPDEATVRVRYDPDYNLSSEVDVLPGRYDFEVEKTGDNKAKIRVVR
ncbi:MAG: hypothetical protein ABEJ56_05170 [Candidatus Nanohaloarchaea archaeon]